MTREREPGTRARRFSVSTERAGTRRRRVARARRGFAALLRRACLAAGGFLLLLALVPPAPARAQETPEDRIEELERQVEALQRALAERDTAGLEELRRRIEALTRALEQLRLGRDVAVPADTSLYGFGPAASKVYRTGEGVSIGGYGEMLYENFASEREDGIETGLEDRLDFLRAIVYIGYKFTDDFLFNSEIEVEHAAVGEDAAGEVALEFAYLDYLVTDRFGVRAGLLLSPMGFLNELHEPPVFLGTTRPVTEQVIIPSTWRENGAGVFGGTEQVSYRAYLLNGFNARGFSAEGLRDGRQSGSEAIAEDFGLVGRIDYVGTLGLVLGTSAYLGNSGQGLVVPSVSGGEEIGAQTFIWEGHADYEASGLDLRGLLAVASVDDVEALNAAQGFTGAESVGERMIGWYVQAGYDVLRGQATTQQLLPYVRFEKVNTQDAVPEGFAADPANDQTVVSLGAAYKPIPNIVVKADYQIHQNEADTGVNQFNIALGYLF